MKKPNRTKMPYIVDKEYIPALEKYADELEEELACVRRFHKEHHI